MITQSDAKKIKEELNKEFPTREELFSKLDGIMAELQAMREEQTIFAYRQGDHSDRIERLELDIFKKSFA